MCSQGCDYHTVFLVCSHHQQREREGGRERRTEGQAGRGEGKEKGERLQREEGGRGKEGRGWENIGIRRGGGKGQEDRRDRVTNKRGDEKMRGKRKGDKTQATGGRMEGREL